MLTGKTLTLFCFLILIPLVFASCSDNKTSQESAKSPPKQEQQAAQTAPQTETPAPAQQTTASSGGACADLLTSACVQCHTLGRICQKLGKKNSRSWSRSGKRMVSKGSKLNSNQIGQIIDCLASEAPDIQAVCK